jgi:cytochrome c oxidase subunit 1
MAIFIASSLMGSLNYVVTVINLRTKGMSMTRLPYYLLLLLRMIIGIVSFQFCCQQLLLIFDRSFGTSFFLSDIYIAGEVLHYTKVVHLYCLSIFYFIPS